MTELMTWYISAYLFFCALKGLRQGGLTLTSKYKNDREAFTLRGAWAYVWSFAFIAFAPYTWNILINQPAKITTIWLQNFGLFFFYSGWLGLKKRVMMVGGRSGGSLCHGGDAVLHGLSYIAFGSVGLAAPVYPQIMAFFETVAARF